MGSTSVHIFLLHLHEQLVSDGNWKNLQYNPQLQAAENTECVRPLSLVLCPVGEALERTTPQAVTFVGETKNLELNPDRGSCGEPAESFTKGSCFLLLLLVHVTVGGTDFGRVTLEKRW